LLDILLVYDSAELVVLHDFFVQAINATEAPKKNTYLENFPYYQYIPQVVCSHPTERLSEYLGSQISPKPASS
jgi:hypothetical protein